MSYAYILNTLTSASKRIEYNQFRPNNAMMKTLVLKSKYTKENSQSWDCLFYDHRIMISKTLFNYLLKSKQTLESALRDIDNIEYLRIRIELYRVKSYASRNININNYTVNPRLDLLYDMFYLHITDASRNVYEYFLKSQKLDLVKYKSIFEIFPVFNYVKKDLMNLDYVPNIRVILNDFDLEYFEESQHIFDNLPEYFNLRNIPCIKSSSGLDSNEFQTSYYNVEMDSDMYKPKALMFNFYKGNLVVSLDNVFQSVANTFSSIGNYHDSEMIGIKNVGAILYGLKELEILDSNHLLELSRCDSKIDIENFCKAYSIETQPTRDMFPFSNFYNKESMTRVIDYAFKVEFKLNSDIERMINEDLNRIIENCDASVVLEYLESYDSFYSYAYALYRGIELSNNSALCKQLYFKYVELYLEMKSSMKRKKVSE